MFGEQILRMIAGLFVGIWVARYLGPEQFGVFSYATAFVAIFGSVAKLGLDGIVVRGLVNEPDKRDIYLGTAFWLKFTGAFITLGIVAFVMQFTSTNHATNIYIFIITSGIVFQSFEVIDFYFQSKVLSKFVSLCKITQLLISSLLKVYFVLTGADLFWFIVISLIDQISLAFTLYIAYNHQKLGSFLRYFDWMTARNLLKDSWPLIFSSIVIIIYMRIDQVMIKEMLGEREVGLYSAALRLSEVWYFIPVIITNSLFPAIINAKKISKKLYYARLQQLYTFMAWTSLGIALPISFSSDWLVTLLYGEDYIAAKQVLMIHVWTNVFVFLGVASGSWFTSENLQRLAFYRSFAGAITNVVLNSILIPIYGIAGAAVASLIAQAMATFVFDVFTPKTRKIFFMKLSTLNVSTLFKRA